MKRAALGLLFLGGITAAVWWLGGAREAAVEGRAGATRRLAEYAARQFSPDCVVVISNPFTQRGGRAEEIYEFQRAAVAGLREGFGEAVELKVEFPRLTPEAEADPGSVRMDPGTKTPLSFMVAAGAFDEVIRKHECGLVVSLIGLPVDLAGFASWNSEGDPKFLLLLPDWRMIGGREAILEAFESGKLAAAVIEKPAVEQGTPALPDGTGPGYLVVTAENARALLEAHPGAFGL